MHKLGRTVMVVALFGMLASNMALAQSDDEISALKEEIAEIKAGQDKTNAALAQIQKLLLAGDKLPTAPAAQPAVGAVDFEPTDLTIGNSAVLGNADAQVTLVGFSDYQCPFCSRHAQNVFPQLVEKYVDTGKVKIVMREFPIQSIHSKAMKASQAALCANEQGSYWEMHDLIFKDNRFLEITELKNNAQTLGLQTGQFNACLDSNKYEPQIRADLVEGQKYGVSGTPSFVLGLTDSKDSNVVNLTKFIRGAKALPQFEEAIDELLASAE